MASNRKYKKRIKKIRFHEKHEKRLRDMIINENPGKYNEYGCLMYLLVDKNEIVNDVIEFPHLDTYKGFAGTQFALGGFKWSFVVCSHMEQFPLNEGFIKDDNKLWISVIYFKKSKKSSGMAKRLNTRGKLKKANEYFNKS